MTDYFRHPDYLALLRGVCEDPADDLPRLVLADFLDENGDANRAELIRVQVEQGLMNWAKGGGVCLVPGFAPPPELRRLVALQRRERELLPVYKMTAREFPTTFTVSNGSDSVMPDFPHATLTRGFVSEVTLTQADFLAHAAAVFSRHPVTAVTLAGIRPAVVAPAGATADQRRYHLSRATLPAVTDPAPRHHAHPSLPWYQASAGWVSDRIPRRTRDGTASRRQNFTHDSGAEAYASLSWDCVCHGRELAGLPLLMPSAVPA